MIIVGLTGGMGSGKTFVASAFEKLGIAVYNSDLKAKELMSTHPTLIEHLKKKFGEEVFKNNVLNRKLIANQIFNNKDLLQWINNLVHPIVQSDFEAWVAKQHSDMVIKEAAILIESGAYKQCHKIIVVTAPENVRINRIIKRDNMTITQIKERMHNQLDDNERLKYANYTIINDGIKVVEEQIIKIYNEIKKN